MIYHKSLVDEDWSQLEQFLELLEPFKILTESCEGNAKDEGQEGAYGVLANTLMGMQYLFNVLDNTAKDVNAAPEQYSDHFSAGVATAHAKLVKYFGLTDQ